MMRSFVFPVTLFASVICASGQQALTVYPAPGTEIYMEVGKTGFMSGKTHHISFPTYNGTVQYDPKNPAGSKVELTIDTPNLTVADKWLSAEDQNKVRKFALNDELATPQYPRITFHSKLISPTGGNAYAIQGDLTIRDQTRTATVNVTFTPDGAGFKVDGESHLKLSEFNLQRPKTGLGAVGTKDDFVVGIHIRADPPR